MHIYSCCLPTPTTQAGLPYHAQAHTSAHRHRCIRRATLTSAGARTAICQIMPEKVRIWGDPLRALYGIKPHFLYPLYQKKITPITVSYD